MSKRILKLSVSKAKTFDQCKRKFYYQYVLKLPTALKDYNAIGSLVHLVLETAFKKWILTKHEGDLKELVKESWQEAQSEKEWKDAVQFNVTETAKQYVIQYYKSYMDQAKRTLPISCEPKFILPLEIGSDLRAEVVGYIDRIDRLDYKTLFLLDYKTTNKVQYLDNFQLGIYVAACLAGPYKGYNFEAAYILLRHAMQLKHMPSPNKNYMSQVEKMVKIASEMDKTLKCQEFPPSFSKLCDYCEFQERCYKETGGPPKGQKFPSPKPTSVGVDEW